MSTPLTSTRTTVRDAVLSGLGALKGAEQARVKAFDLSTNFLSADEIKRDITYCVVVTDETLTGQTVEKLESLLSVVLVLYVRDTTDLRAKLDAAIEDVYEAMVLVRERLKHEVSHLQLTELTTDDNTTAVKGVAQAVQRWTCRHQRRALAF